jgi:hypothetical protein
MRHQGGGGGVMGFNELSLDHLPMIGETFAIPPVDDLIFLGKSRVKHGWKLLVRDTAGKHHNVTIARDDFGGFGARWEEAEAPPVIHAYCYASGQIGFGAEIPDGAMPVCHGPAPLVRAEVSVTARLAHDGETLLVPGVPEAESQNEGLGALARWCEWAGTGNRNEDVIWAWSGNEGPETTDTEEAVNG